MIRCVMFGRLLALILLLGVSLPPGWAFELETHRRITRETYDRSKVADVLRSLGIDPERRLSGGLLQGSHPPVDWLVEGVLDEDDIFSVPPLRFRHHFYDPVNNSSLTTAPLSERAPDWALEDQQEFSTQRFSYRDARQAFFTALTATAPRDREIALAQTFEILGHVIHLIQDMASPPHTRNDSHGGGIFGPRSLYERHLDQLQVLARLNFNGTPVRLNLPRQYWITQDGRGLAEFVNRNFVSEGTNFTRREEGARGGIYPSPVLRLGVDEQGRPFETTLDIQTQLEPGLRDRNGNLIEGSVTFFANNFQDPITGAALRNERMTTLSLFDRDLQQRGAAQVFTLNRYNIEAQAAFLVPRAVGYSAGLLDYFFRGRLKGILVRAEGPPAALGSPPFTAQLRLTNESSEEMQGDLRLYGDAPDGTRTQLAGPPLDPTGEWTAQTLPPGATRTVSVPVPGPLVAQFLLVFQGRLGQEEGAVVGRVVGPEFLEEWDTGLPGNHPWAHSTEETPIFGPNPDNGVSTTQVVGGRLIKDNTRNADACCERSNASFLGRFTLADGTILRDFQGPLPLPITPQTEIQVKIDAMTINAQPPCTPGFTCASQFVAFDFTNGRSLQFTVPEQASNPGPNGVALFVTPGVPLTVNIQEVFTQAGIPVDNLLLTTIHLIQRLSAPVVDADPLRLQHLEVDYLRVGEALPPP